MVSHGTTIVVLFVSTSTSTTSTLVLQHNLTPKLQANAMDAQDGRTHRQTPSCLVPQQRANPCLLWYQELRHGRLICDAEEVTTASQPAEHSRESCLFLIRTSCLFFSFFSLFLFSFFLPGRCWVAFVPSVDVDVVNTTPQYGSSCTFERSIDTLMIRA